MSSEFGKLLKVSVFGQSHGTAIGVVMDGLPAGEEIDRSELQRFLDRRRPGKNSLSTARNEGDVPEFLSDWRAVRPVVLPCAPSSATATSTPRTMTGWPTSPAPATPTTPPG